MGRGPALVGERKLAPCRKRIRVFIDFVPLRMKWACICAWHDGRKGIRGRRHTSLGQLCIHNPDSRNFGRQGQGQNSLWTSSTTCSALTSGGGPRSGTLKSRGWNCASQDPRHEEKAHEILYLIRGQSLSIFGTDRPSSRQQFQLAHSEVHGGNGELYVGCG